MKDRPRVFMDMSAIFAAMWSETGDGRLILKLGEAQVVDLYISSQVLGVLEAVLRRKASGVLSGLALLLDRSRIRVGPDASSDLVLRAGQWIDHTGAGRILADAMTAGVDYFVTLEGEHFLNNEIVQKAVSFQMGAPGDFLAWFRDADLR
jgi:hypothetical protein